MPWMMPPVGKSGPFTTSSSSASVTSGSSMISIMPSIISRRLWGGMLVAMPTAMPVDPLTSRLGRRAGSTMGSSSVASKLGRKSTVSLSMSMSMVEATRLMRHSV
jgi:hypothetical protein